MQSLSAAFLCGIVLFTSGCTTVPRDFTFAEADSAAFVVASIDVGEREYTDGYSFNFLPVDIASGAVTKKLVTISITNPGGTRTDEIGTAAGNETGLLMGGKLIEAGHYVLYQMTYAHVIMTASLTISCLDQFAPIYKFEGGHVNLVALPTPTVLVAPQLFALRPDDAKVLAAFEQRRPEYPGISAPARMVSPVALATFDRGKGLLGQDSCRLPAQVQIRERAEQ